MEFVIYLEFGAWNLELICFFGACSLELVCFLVLGICDFRHKTLGQSQVSSTALDDQVVQDRTNIWLHR